MNLKRVLSKNGYNSRTIDSFIKELNKESEIYDEVTKEMFETKINSHLLDEL